MRVKRRDITIALRDKLAKSYDYATVEAPSQIWSNATSFQQPYLGLSSPRQAANRQMKGATAWKMQYAAVVYVRKETVGAEDPLAVQLFVDDLLDAIEASMDGDYPGAPNTLGGLVEDAYIDGDVTIDAGSLDDQMAFLIPITVDVGGIPMY